MNDFWAFVQAMKKQGEHDPEIIGTRYVDFVAQHVASMKAVDPSIKIFVEVQMEDNQPSVPVIDKLMETLDDDITERNSLRSNGVAVPITNSSSSCKTSQPPRSSQILIWSPAAPVGTSFSM